ncbi:hypothetical protein ACFX14_000326 [Malus domestica]
MNGMDPSYTIWLFHDDATRKLTSQIGDENFKLKVEDVEALLYEGCTKYTKLSATLVVHKIKASIDAIDKLLDKLVQALKDMFPEGNTLPNSMNLTKKLLKVFHLGFEKIDACVNDCCLIWKTLNNLRHVQSVVLHVGKLINVIITFTKEFLRRSMKLVGLANDGINSCRQLNSRYS